jgi:hypothetical protein
MQSMVCCNCCNNCCGPTSTTNDAPPSQSVRVPLLVSKQLQKPLGLVPCRLLQNNPEIRDKKILGLHLACLLAEQSNTGFVNSETDNRIGGYVTVEQQQQQQQQQHIWVGAGLEKKGFLFLCCSNYWCFCLFTGGG